MADPLPSSPGGIPALSPEQQAALGVADEIERGGAGVWTSVDAAELATSVRERIYTPTLINQALSPHCAPAALAFDLADKKPRVYAETIRDLYKKGKASMPGTNFELSASESLRRDDHNKYFGIKTRTTAKPEADWILLSSIRNSESWNNWYWGTSGLVGWASGMTLPQTLVSWLRGFGYNEIKDETNVVATKGLPDLTVASDLFLAGWRVFLLINRKMLKAPTQSDGSLTPDHYVVLISRVAYESVRPHGGFLSLDAMTSDQYVNFVVSTWGKAQAVPVNAMKKLTGEDFCKNFYGYVAAKT